ncbi:MAG TPA: ABC transporter permease [Gemmatimonadaceae bacterium]|nr:ABC transporter permease [Gemmatimonadaceae bacterium]
MLRRIYRGVTALLFPARADATTDREIRDFIEQRAHELMRDGLSHDEAARRARLEVGNVTATREEVRASGWEHGLDLLIGDVRYALRRLRRDPGFTVVAVLTLALGIGAATAIFSAVNPILFRALPYPDVDRVVAIHDRTQAGGAAAPTYGTYEELLARSRSFDLMSATDLWRPSLTGTDEPERLEGQRVTAEFFRTLGVLPVAGRGFSADEDVPGAARVAVLSDRLLQRRFGGDRSIVGTSITLGGEPYQVVGIMPPDFVDMMAPATDIWSPLQAQRRADRNSREWGHHYRIVGRLKPRVQLDAARAELASIAANVTGEFPRVPWASMSSGVLVRGLQEDVTAAARPAMIAILAATAVLLLIACVNVANLLLARSARRRGEFALRAALGAARTRLVRQLLTESVLLALIGGALGLFVAQGGVGALIALSPPGLPRADMIRVDGAAFVFGLIVTTIVGVVVGLMPAISASRANVRGAMQGSASGSRTVAGGRGATRGTLVVAEVALALVLLVGAGLLLRSLDRLFANSPGIEPANVITMQVVDAGRNDPTGMERLTFFDQVADAVRAVPGVTDVGVTSQLPLSGDADAYGFISASFPERQPGEDGAANRYTVTPDYFKALRIPLKRGRLLDASDRANAPPSLLVSESLARGVFGERDPIGQRMRFGPDVDGTRPWGIVVGVVGDVKQESLASPSVYAFYVRNAQWRWVDPVMSLVVRTSGDAAALAGAIQRAVWSVDRNKPITRVATMNQLISRTASERQFASVIYATFAIAALLLSAVGLYGVISGRVTERTREIGIRTALGATRSEIVRGVLANGLLLTALGVGIGAVGASAASRLLETLLYGISRTDPTTYIAVIVLLCGVAVLACWAPARRAAAVDPVITLRSD